MLYNLVTDVVLLLLASAALAMRSSDGTTLVILRSHASLLVDWTGGGGIATLSAPFDPPDPLHALRLPV